LDRNEALAVLHEIHESCRESVTLTCVSLDARQVQPFGLAYQIRIKGELDNASRGIIETILEKHKLSMREENGYVIVF